MEDTYQIIFKYVFLISEWEKNIGLLPSACTLTGIGDQAWNLSMCPDQEPNQRARGAQDDDQPAEPLWQGSPIRLLNAHLLKQHGLAQFISKCDL